MKQRHVGLIAVVLIMAPGSAIPTKSMVPANVRPHLQASSSSPTTRQSRMEQADKLYQEAFALRQRGDLRNALIKLNRALKFYQDDRNGTMAVMTLNSIGMVYVDLKYSGLALEHFTRALSISRAMRDGRSEGVTLYCLGVADSILGRQGNALVHLNDAGRLLQAAGDNAGVAEVHDAMGEVYLRSGDRQNALKHLTQALSRRQALGDTAGQAITLVKIAETYPTAVRQSYYQQALSSLRATGDRQSEATLLFEIGAGYERKGNLLLAHKHYEDAIALHERFRTSARLEELKTGLAERAAEVYRRAVLLRVRLRQLEPAFDLAERARARTFLDQLGNTRLDIRQGAPAELIQQEETLRRELAELDYSLRQERTKPSDQYNAAETDRLVKQLNAKQQEYDAFLIRLKLENPKYAALVSVSPLKLSDVQKRLDHQTTLLSYFVTGDKTLVFVVTRSSFEVVDLFRGEKDLRAAITEFRGFPSLSDTSPPSLTKLYNWLIAPLKTRLKTPVVGIIPHGILHYLPFAALKYGEHFLGDDYTLFYLPSASTLQFIQQERKSGGNSLLAIAQGQPEGFPQLAGAEQEAREIAELYNTQALVGLAATEAAFSEQAGKFNILHLAAHAELNPINAPHPHLILAPGKEMDGLLEVREIYGLNLSQADLVVLSACQTELGLQSRGDDIVSLSRAFIYAGTPTVVASLWKVDDQATRLLMKSFYTHIKQGDGKAAALRAAQAETRARHPHPYFWAAFVLTGDPGAKVAPR